MRWMLQRATETKTGRDDWKHQGESSAQRNQITEAPENEFIEWEKAVQL
jgi:hypothetical protein